MRRRRFAGIAAAAAVAALGAAPLAWAPHPINTSPATNTTSGELDLRFRLDDSRTTGIGYDASAITAPPVGSRFVITAALVNRARQFGKPAGAPVGRLLIECTVIASGPDGLCNGIARVPTGFFTFSGDAPFGHAKVRHWALTGAFPGYLGVGEIRVSSSAAGSFVLIRSLGQ